MISRSRLECGSKVGLQYVYSNMPTYDQRMLLEGNDGWDRGSRSGASVRAGVKKLAMQATGAGRGPMPEVELDLLGDTAIALLAYEARPAATSVPPGRLSKLVDHVSLVLMTRSRPVK